MIFTIRESTLDSYKAMIKNQIKPYLGDRPLSALTTQELQKFYNTVKKKGRVKADKLHGTELADSMVRGIHMMLHEALDMAVRLRLIVKNPTVGTTIPKNNYPPKQILNDEQLVFVKPNILLPSVAAIIYYCKVATMNNARMRSVNLFNRKNASGILAIFVSIARCNTVDSSTYYCPYFFRFKILIIVIDLDVDIEVKTDVRFCIASNHITA